MCVYLENKKLQLTNYRKPNIGVMEFLGNERVLRREIQYFDSLFSSTISYNIYNAVLYPTSLRINFDAPSNIIKTDHRRRFHIPPSHANSKGEFREKGWRERPRECVINGGDDAEITDASRCERLVCLSADDSSLRLAAAAAASLS